MNLAKWFLIISGTVLGVLLPLVFSVVVMCVLLLGYVACYYSKWLKLQILLESLFGGLATGLGLHFVVTYGMRNQILPMLVTPLFTWLVLRIIFMKVETRFSLSPVERTSPPQPARIEQSEGAVPQTGHSAWSGDTEGRAGQPDKDGRYLQYRFICTGEIAMGGPTYGDAIFNNGCAFRGVGPSIVLSEDGRYAFMTLPSRGAWENILADLREKTYYIPEGIDGLWEIDRIEHGIIHGRVSPLTSNTPSSIAIAEVIEKSVKQFLVEDDGWWVQGYPERKPFPRYGVVTIGSKTGQHRVMFVPDLKPFKHNPFERDHHPQYTVLVDDEMLGMETSSPTGCWIDGPSSKGMNEGRFLLVAGIIVDFLNPETNAFDIQKRVELVFQECDEHTRLSMSMEIADLGQGRIQVDATVLPRSSGWTVAEIECSDMNQPYDEDTVKYWDAQGNRQHQQRTRIVRQVEYIIDLVKYRELREPRSCTEIKLVNRAIPARWAHLHYSNAQHAERLYAAYTCTTSCGLSIANVIHEAVWSHCGRYLAVVRFAPPPQVPDHISVIDFETGTVRDLPGRYALPSFIWFDATMLQFTHIVACREAITYGPGRHEAKTIRLDDSDHQANPYDLLIGGRDARREALEKVAQSRQSDTGYASASVNQVLQHCILFAPEFNQPVLQPPSNAQS